MHTTLRFLVALVALGLLVGCGSQEDTAGAAGDDTSSQTGEPSRTTEEPSPGPEETGPFDFTQVALISVSNAEGTVSDEATVLDSRQAVEEFAGQFSGSQMATALNRAYQRADLPQGEVLVGAVVAVACQAPTDVEVAQTEDGLTITAEPVKSKVQCLVPVTTVALVSVPEAAV